MQAPCHGHGPLVDMRHVAGGSEEVERPLACIESREE